MVHPKHVWLNNMNFKNIVSFIKAINKTNILYPAAFALRMSTLPRLIKVTESAAGRFFFSLFSNGYLLGV